MKITISKSLLVFGASVAATFIATIAVMTFTLQTVKIEGEEYKRIIAGRELVADIRTPPLFLIEAYLLASEMEIEHSLATENLARINELKKEYEERVAYWREADLPEDIKQIIETEITPAADSFWHDINDKFVVAETSGDEQMRKEALAQLRSDFINQKHAVDDLAVAATSYLKESEKLAHDHAVLYSGLASITAAIAVLTLIAGLFIFRHRAIQPLVKLADYMTVLAGGDQETEVPFTKRSDEMGDMARSVAVFRQQGIEKVQAENENRKQAELIDAQRTEHLETQTREAESLQVVISQLGAGLERLSQFNIRMTLDDPFEERFEQLRHDFNTSLGKFQETMSSVLDKSREIEASSESLRSSSDQLAGRTEQQAAALEETAAALEEITINVQQSSDRTAETRTKTINARRNVEKSTTVVHDAIDAMQRIEEASGQIGNITNVIDEIAFQTNLLALNAGVEAARAGEAGKGFAVVAQEVRELAQRSASAAKEIKELIGRSGQEVAGGVELVKVTGEALQEIESDITGIAADVDAIALAAKEQSTGLQEVNASVSQMDNITQQNAAMVEETTAATHSLTGEVSVLVQLVGQFVFNRRESVRDTPEEQAKTIELRGALVDQTRAA